MIYKNKIGIRYNTEYSKTYTLDHRTFLTFQPNKSKLYVLRQRQSCQNDVIHLLKFYTKCPRHNHKSTRDVDNQTFEMLVYFIAIKGCYVRLTDIYFEPLKTHFNISN